MFLKKAFLTKVDSQKLSERIDRFESSTRCELVIHVRSKLGENPLVEAEKLFHKFKLHQTKHNAAIFVVVSTKDREYAVWVDKNVKVKTSDDLWRQAGKILQENLKLDNRLAAFLQLIDFIQPTIEKLHPQTSEKFEKTLSNEIIEEES